MTAAGKKHHLPAAQLDPSLPGELGGIECLARKWYFTLLSLNITIGPRREETKSPSLASDGRKNSPLITEIISRMFPAALLLNSPYCILLNDAV